MNQAKSFKVFFDHKINISTNTKYSFFLKRKPKYGRTIKFSDDEFFNSGRRGIIKSEKTLYQLGRSLKYSTNLDIQNLKSILSRKPSKFQKAVKIFQNLKSISLPPGFGSINFIFSTMLLKQCKHLVSLSSQIPNRDLYIREPPESPVWKIERHFMKAFQIQELKTVNFSGHNSICVPFSKYPSTLREISFRLNTHNLSPFQEEILQQSSQAFSHIMNLQYLDLFLPIFPYSLSQMLASIPNPQNLKSLGFTIGSTQQPDPNSISCLIETLERFQSLKGFKIQSNTHSEIVLNIIKTLNSRPLESFELLMALSDEMQLSPLGYFLSSLKSLKYLKLIIFNNATMHVAESFISFFEQISTLTQLKTFQLQFENPIPYPTKSDEPDFFPTMSQSLSTLPHLKEFVFQYFKKKDWTPELSSLSHLLRKQSQNLTRLEIHLPIKTNLAESNDFSEFLLALGQLTNLEVLLIGGMHITDEKWSQSFLETLCRLQNLRQISLMNHMAVEGDIFYKMITKLASRKKVEHLEVGGVTRCIGLKINPNQLSHQKLQKKNPNLDKCYILI